MMTKKDYEILHFIDNCSDSMKKSIQKYMDIIKELNIEKNNKIQIEIDRIENEYNSLIEKQQNIILANLKIESKNL